MDPVTRIEASSAEQPLELGVVLVDGGDVVRRVSRGARMLLHEGVAAGACFGGGATALALTELVAAARRDGTAHADLTVAGRPLHALADTLGPDGEVSVVLGDCSLLADATARARESARLVELFFEHAPDIVTILEPDLRQRSANGAVQRLLGYEPSARIEDNLSYVHPDDLPALQERIETLLSGGAKWLPPYRYRVRAADGTWRWLETSSSDLRDTELQGFLSFSRDVTDHELEIRANVEARARIEALVTSFHDPVLLVDVFDTIVMANDAFRRLYAIPLEDVVGLPHGELWARIRPLFSTPEAFERGAEAMLSSESATRGAELHLTDGRALEVDHIPVRDGDQLLGRVWVMRDVTAQREDERRRRQLLELEREARATADARNLELAQVDEMRRRLVSTVSHELRTPLTAILSHLQLLLDDDGARFEPDDLGAIEAAERNARRLRRFVDELLDIQRMESHGVDLQIELVDLGVLVTEQAGALGPVAATQGVSIRTHSSGSTRVPLDDGRMRQVVDNLLSNAIRYTSSDGNATTRVERSGTEMVLTVTDDGMGISRDDLPHVFEPFFRGTGDNGHVAGTGLGLSIARAIVEAHGGTIACASEPGVGTTFTVRLPAPPERAR